MSVPLEVCLVMMMRLVCGMKSTYVIHINACRLQPLLMLLPRCSCASLSVKVGGPRIYVIKDGVADPAEPTAPDTVGAVHAPCWLMKC